MKHRAGTIVAIVALATASCAVAVLVYAFAVEPYWLEVTHHSVTAPMAPPIKIAHLTDIHTRGFGDRERRLLAILETERPDLIVVTGDTVVDHGSYELCRKVLSRLHAPLGVWVVRGNWENWRPVANERMFYAQAGVRFLLNQNHQVGTLPLWVVGLDDAMSGHPNLNAALVGVPPDVYTIGLIHSPAYFERVAGRCHLVFAGHTHGGQIRLPFVGPVWLPAGCGRFLAGWYEAKGSRMYVSRGIGTSIIHARFLSRPELAFVTLGQQQ